MFSKLLKGANDNRRTSNADINATMKMFSSFLLDRDCTSESDTDDRSLGIEDGTLARVDIQPNEFKSNVVLIKVPENVRSSSDPPHMIATVDRSIPGNTDLKGNAILDKIYPNLPKVTPFEEPDPQVEDITPQRIQTSSQEHPKPPHANLSNAKNRMRQNYPTTEEKYRKPAHEPYVRKLPQEQEPFIRNLPHAIDPWIPGAEPFAPAAEPFAENWPNVHSRSKSGSRNLAEFPQVIRMPVNDGYGPNRETLPYHHPVSLSDGSIPNFSAGYEEDVIPPRYPVDFNDGQQPRYFDDSSQPGFSGDLGCVPPHHYPDSYSDGPSRSLYSTGLLRTPQNKYNKSNPRWFQQSRINRRGISSMNGSYTEGQRDPGMDYPNRTSRDAGHYQNRKRFNSKHYPKRGHHIAQSLTFPNEEEENYVENRPRGARQKPFRLRRRQNF